MFDLPKYREPDFSQEKFKNAPDASWEEVTIKGVAPEKTSSDTRRQRNFCASAITNFNILVAIPRR